MMGVNKDIANDACVCIRMASSCEPARALIAFGKKGDWTFPNARFPWFCTGLRGPVPFFSERAYRRPAPAARRHHPQTGGNRENRARNPLFTPFAPVPDATVCLKFRAFSGRL